MDDNQLTLVVVLVMAPIIGSFLGVLITRLPAGQKIVSDRSRCDHCGQILSPSEMVPIFSYVISLGRCRMCGGKIAPFHILIELAAILVPLWAGTVDDGARLAADCVLGWALLSLAWIDFKHLILPDAITLPLLLIGLAWTAYATPELLASCTIGAIIGYGAFRLIGFLYALARGREGLGQGDAKLLAAAGAWVGWEQLGDVVLIAAFSGLGLALLERLRGRQLDAATAIPFGPCLTVGIWLVWLYGERWLSFGQFF